jgi:hypothetical protein
MDSANRKRAAAHFCVAYIILHRYNSRVTDGLRLSHTSAMILQAIVVGHVYGYMVTEATGFRAVPFIPLCAD